MWRVNLALGLLSIAALMPNVAGAADPCAAPHARSLVMSGGGAKGAFEAGAAYHLIVHRACDFAEISGISVGAINGALLAQAPATSDAAASLANLRDAAESLIDEWTALGRSRDMIRARPLGKIRFALFGLDSVTNLESLRLFIRDSMALEALASGRELRVGFTTFVDGRYRELVINSGGRVDAQTAHDVILGSAVVPVFGRMVRAAPSPSTGPLQLADGTLRHATPVTSYFLACRAASDPNAAPICVPLTGADAPPHPRTEQLFVIVTSPFARRNDLRPLVDPRTLDRDGTMTDGRQILVRSVDLLVDTMYRDDLDDMLTYNELIEWHAGALAGSAPLAVFPLGSYNASDAPTRHSLPYEIAIVSPQREDADPMTLFDVEPATQRRQLFCGCIAANDTMREQFGLADMEDRCAARFPGLAGKRAATEVSLQPAVCRDEREAVSLAPGTR
jgi:NTE family protein